MDDSCYGILVDVSGSMQHALSIDDDIKINDKYANRGQVVFNSIFKIIREGADNIDENPYYDEMFTLAFGLSDAEHQHCDLISLFEHLLSSYESKQDCIKMLNEYGLSQTRTDRKFLIDQYIKTKQINNNEVCQIIGHVPLIKMAENNGAPYCKKYIKKHLTKEDAGYLFQQFYHNQHLIPRMVNDLPDACKNSTAHGAAQAGNHGTGVGGAGGVAAGMAIGALGGPVGMLFGALIGGAIGGGSGKIAKNKTQKAESEAARKALQTGKDLVVEPLYDIIRKPRSSPDVIRIVNNLSMLYSTEVKDPENDNERSLDINKLMKDIKPYIFGGTPMCKSLKYAQKIFALSSQQNKKRLLIISDGEATDGNPMTVAAQLTNNTNVIVMCCFITNQDIKNPKQLFGEGDIGYNIDCNQLSKGAKVMLEMASSVSNSDSALTFLQSKYGWQLSHSGESKLFVQANHPQVIDQFCSIVKRVGLHNDAIMDMIGHYNLNQFINDKLSEQKAPEQIGPTCYANAAAIGIHLATSRIIGYAGGVPDFDSLRAEIINNNLEKAKISTRRVLKHYCPKYRLRYQQWAPLDPKDKTDSSVGLDTVVRKIICERRPVVATFKLHPGQWTKFKDFFTNNPKGILTKNDLEIKMNDAEIEAMKVAGHAIVLVRCEPSCLVFMNSWGTDWADGGFFRAENTDVLRKMRFFDVFWEEEDLLDDEKCAYEKYCKSKTENLISYISPLCYAAGYVCPECKQESKIEEYSGHFLEAKCPKCNKSFKPNGIGLLRSLYDSQITKALQR